MSAREIASTTVDTDPRDCCPECGERGRFDLGYPDRPQCMNRSCWVEFFRVAP